MNTRSNSVAQTFRDPKGPEASNRFGIPVLKGLSGSVTRAFTLIELLAVIAIIGILAAIALPNLKGFKSNKMAAATRQLVDDINRARRLAISQRTTVYMVFVPANFWSDPGFLRQSVAERTKGLNLYDKQLIGYTFVSLRKIGDQPGAKNPDYLSEWRTLPDGAFIVPDKFTAVVPRRVVYNAQGRDFWFNPFNVTDTIPFPSPDSDASPYATLPYLAFNYLGQIESGKDEVIPLALGSVGISRDAATKKARAVGVTLTENPPGNSTNSFNLVHIDWLTGRARVERLEIK